jgi:hypothetical protein
MRPAVEDAIGYINTFFTLYFVLEIWVKVMAMRFSRFWECPWNRFDVFCVLPSCLGMALHELGAGANTGVVACLNVLRLLRICRLLSLAKKLPGIRRVFNAAVLALAPMANVLSLLSLLFFVFAVLGVQLFAQARMRQYDGNVNSGNLSDDVNFRNFPMAVLTLISVTTGEGWNALMHEVARSDDCKAVPVWRADVCGYEGVPAVGAGGAPCVPMDGCGTPAAYVYFIMFQCLVSFIFINLFIAVVIDGFNEALDMEKSAATKRWHAAMGLVIWRNRLLSKPGVKLRRPSQMHGLRHKEGDDVKVRKRKKLKKKETQEETRRRLSTSVSNVAVAVAGPALVKRMSAARHRASVSEDSQIQKQNTRIMI